MIPTVVWGTGNVGRAAIRAVAAHPELELSAVLVANPDKVGRDAGRLAGLGHDLGVTARDDVEAVLAQAPGAVVYAASGDMRPDE
ncbi:dihydrodipicolinate reductase, partial [Streptomyces sp. NPDC054835]